MNLKQCFAAAAIAGAAIAPLTTHAAAIGFSLTIDDVTNSVTSSLAGVGVTELGSQLWRISFSASPIAIFGSSYEMSWVSGGDDTGVNWLVYESGSDFLLYGDTTLPGSTGDICGSTPSPLAQGVTCGIGFNAAVTDGYFITVLDPTPTGTVSSPATLVLAGLGLLAAAGVSRRRR